MEPHDRGTQLTLVAEARAGDEVVWESRNLYLHREGGGGGGGVTPVGYIELKDGRSRFVPVVHPARMLAIVCGTALAALVIMRR
jgi:hypothetical protein